MLGEEMLSAMAKQERERERGGKGKVWVGLQWSYIDVKEKLLFDLFNL